MSIGQFAEFNKTERLLALYAQGSLDGLASYTRELLDAQGAPTALLSGFVATSAPSLDWTPDIKDVEKNLLAPEKLLDSLIIGYEFEDPDTLRQFREWVLQADPPAANEDGFLSIGANPGATSAEHWQPGGSTRAVFGHQRDARAQIRAQALANAGLTGKRVNVLIVDQGLSSAHLRSANYGGGFNHNGILAGSAERTSHGMMVARAILDIAPDARLFDVPIIPSRIHNVLTRMDFFSAVYVLLKVVVAVLRNFPAYSGPWLVVNAWAIFNRTSEIPRGDYTQDGHPLGHPFNLAVELVTQTMDVVFAAGNSGQYRADPRSGPTDRGPGHSIWGANAHQGTVTAGAVRTDDLWIGMSSQGPVREMGTGPVLLNQHKPDLAAPGFFRDDFDAATHYTGSSAACAVTAGAIAALRSNPMWDQASMPPNVMRDSLTASARKTLGPVWNNRIGHGILDTEIAMDVLANCKPK